MRPRSTILTAMLAAAILVLFSSLGTSGASSQTAGQEAPSPTTLATNDPAAFIPVPKTDGKYTPPLEPQNVGGPDTRVQVTNTTAVPFRWIVNLAIDFNGDGIIDKGCTGEMVGPRLVLTAGHCVYDPVLMQSAHYVILTPGQNGPSAPYGHQLADGSALSITIGWASGDPNYDLATITLPDQALYNQVGAFTVAVADDSYLNGESVNVAGYPGDKPYGTQWSAFGKITAFTSNMISYDADTAGGEDGGPVWIYIGTNRYLVGVHTRGVGDSNCAASSNCGTRITSHDAAYLEVNGANPHVNLAGATPSPTQSPTPTPTPTSGTWSASNFHWYQLASSDHCDLTKPIPPGSPFPPSLGLCAAWELQIPDGTYTLRTVWAQDGTTLYDSSSPNSHLYPGTWNNWVNGLLQSGTYSLALYANGVFLGTAQVVITSSPTLGNANCDNRIDGADVIAVLDYVGGIPNSAGCIGNADVDGDGHVTPFDALLILKYWAGLISTFPAGG
jgi:V8-like Glu-specific endopeptidase